jgi:hypothetical protein
MFASLNSISKHSHSRRDDLQSLFYIMIFLLNGTLPWTDFGKKFKEMNFSFDDYLKERLKMVYQMESIDMCPVSLRPIFRKVMLLGFKDVPPYEEVIQILKKEIIKEI